MTLTDHGRKRLDKRAAGNDRLFEEALAVGLRSADAAGAFRRYLDKIAIAHHTTPIVHKGHVFVVGEGGVLITVFPLQHRFVDVAIKIARRKAQGAKTARKECRG